MTWREMWREPVVKRLTAWTVLLFLILMALFFLNGQMAAGRLESELSTRESAVAGRLVRTGAASEEAVRNAFTSQSLTAADQAAGTRLFTGTGYRPAAVSVLLPGLPGLLRGITLQSGGAAALFGALLFSLSLAALRAVLTCTNRAALQAARVGRGNFQARLEAGAEGVLGQMQSAFNEMTLGVQGAYDKLNRERTFLRDLISDISHQLKTPLAALKMYQEILLQEPMSEPARNFTVKSGEQIERMEWLVMGLLKMARIEADRLSLHLVRYSLRQVAEQAVADFASMSEQKGVRVALADGTSPSLVCDAAWLREAVGNVVKNCIECTPPGGNVSLKLHETPVAVSLTVRDTGPGIHPDDLPFVFRRFYRGHGRTNGGSGIGLSLARAIVEQMDGTLNAGGTFGQGAVFTFLFLREKL